MTASVGLEVDFFHAYEQLVIGVLTAKGYSWPGEMPKNFQDYFLARSRNDGVQLLIHKAAASNPSWSGWPSQLRKNLSETAQNDAIVDAMRQQDFAQLYPRLLERNILPVLLKGAALSITHYPDSYLRTRHDTDFFIPEARLKDFRRIVAREGYRFDVHTGETDSNYQQTFSRKTDLGVVCIYDAHWKLCNPVLFAEALSYEEVLSASRESELFGVKVRTISQQQALLHACLHRIAHHYDEQKLIWLFDIHLLLEKTDLEWRDQFYRLAQSKGVESVCRAGIEAAIKLFQTPVPEEWVQRFQKVPENKNFADFTGKQLSVGKLFLLNLAALPKTKQKIRFIYEKLFPSWDFMRHKYGLRSKVLLPWFYIRRLGAGFPKLFKKISKN